MTCPGFPDAAGSELPRVRRGPGLHLAGFDARGHRPGFASGLHPGLDLARLGARLHCAEMARGSGLDLARFDPGTPGCTWPGFGAPGCTAGFPASGGFTG